jgi:hypothetical protein
MPIASVVIAGVLARCGNREMRVIAHEFIPTPAPLRM